MRLNNEGKSTSKLWLVGGVVGAIALAGGSAFFAGGRDRPADGTTNSDAASTATPAATDATLPEGHSEGDGHNHGAEGHSEGDGHNHGAEATTPTPDAAASPQPATTAKPTAAAKPAASGKAVKTQTIQGMKVEDLRIGTGKEAKNGTSVSVDYRGFLQDGTVFDESYKRGEPFETSLPGQVIDGWNLGIPGMKEGGKRRLTVPGNLAYGPNSPTPTIPPNATLIFEVELKKVS
ncbi:MAG TPA: FKBP-type peptidyl-prolyl cis-trans isomerase [Abditibacteriaceae bacterium]|jgi:peptidylprolyl isomerase